MSDIAKLIADVTAHGGRLWLDGGTVRYAAPRGALPDALMARMRDAKAAIAAHLAAARLVVTASDPAHERESVVSLPVDVETPDTLTASFLAVPELAIWAPGRRLGWAEVPGASGYMVALRPSGWVAPRWEAWRPTAQPIDFSADEWPGGDTEATVTAVAAPGVTTRQVASTSARALRVTPWLQQATYRVSTCRKVL